MPSLSILVVSPSIVERSRLIRVLLECRPDWKMVQASNVPDAMLKIDTQKPDIVLFFCGLYGQADLDATGAHAAAAGIDLIALHGAQASRLREDISAEEWDPTAPSTAVQCLDDLLERIDALEPRRTGQGQADRNLPVPPARRLNGPSPSAATVSSRTAAPAPPDPRDPQGTDAGQAGSSLPSRSEGRDDPVVVIGASTGGIDALMTVLAHFPADCPPTAIVQHTGRGFSLSMVRVLSRKCAARIVVAEEQLLLEPGMVCVAGGLDGHLHLQELPDRRLRCSIQGGPQVSGQRPSIDVLFRSATPFAERVIGVLLTGMGADGAEGLLALRKGGATTIGQDEATSIVYGMPRVAFELGAVCHQLPLHLIGPAIRQLVQTGDMAGPKESRFHE